MHVILSLRHLVDYRRPRCSPSVLSPTKAFIAWDPFCVQQLKYAPSSCFQQLSCSISVDPVFSSCLVVSALILCSAAVLKYHRWSCVQQLSWSISADPVFSSCLEVNIQVTLPIQFPLYAIALGEGYITNRCFVVLYTHLMYFPISLSSHVAANYLLVNSACINEPHGVVRPSVSPPLYASRYHNLSLTHYFAKFEIQHLNCHWIWRISPISLLVARGCISICSTIWLSEVRWPWVPRVNTTSTLCWGNKPR